jgi:hypothetical protein
MQTLYTKVTNVSDPAKTLNLQFLPPRGRKLAPAEEILIPGDIRTFVGADAGSELSGRSRDLMALEAAIEDGLIEVEFPLVAIPEEEDP